MEIKEILKSFLKSITGRDIKWISTKEMKNDNAPKGQVLIQYLEPSFGGWNVEFGIGYFDNPNDYEEGGEGWKHWNTDNTLNVIAYCELPDKWLLPNPFKDKTQKDIYKEYGTYTPNLGNIGL